MHPASRIHDQEARYAGAAISAPLPAAMIPVKAKKENVRHKSRSWLSRRALEIKRLIAIKWASNSKNVFGVGTGTRGTKCWERGTRLIFLKHTKEGYIRPT
eukprot:scaffold186730_cov15-Tisochrysis_lutea.AAC.1